MDADFQWRVKHGRERKVLPAGAWIWRESPSSVNLIPFLAAGYREVYLFIRVNFAPFFRRGCVPHSCCREHGEPGRTCHAVYCKQATSSTFPRRTELALD